MVQVTTFFPATPQTDAEYATNITGYAIQVSYGVFCTKFTNATNTCSTPLGSAKTLKKALTFIAKPKYNKHAAYKI